MLTTRVHVPVKTAMEKEQTRERERYTRTIASRRIWTPEKSSYWSLYYLVTSLQFYVNISAKSDHFRKVEGCLLVQVLPQL